MHREALGAQPSPMPNPLDHQAELVQRVLDRLFDVERWRGADPLVNVQQALGARGAAIVHLRPSEPSGQSGEGRAGRSDERARGTGGGGPRIRYRVPPEQITSYANRHLGSSQTVRCLVLELDRRRRRGNPCVGVFAADDTAPASDDVAMLVVELPDDSVPLGARTARSAAGFQAWPAPPDQRMHPSRFSVAVFCGVPRHLVELGESLCHVVRAFAAATGLAYGRRPGDRPASIVDGDAVLDAERAELATLKELRLHCGILPRPLERRCAELFDRLLRQVHMIFEPVVGLDPCHHALGVRSWEALARLGGAHHAPMDLFTTAERFGGAFTVELDASLAHRALRQFAAAHRNSARRHGPPPPLSINVSLRSLWSISYQQRLATALAEVGLDPGNIVLELSEKEPVGVPAPLGLDDFPPHTEWYVSRADRMRSGDPCSLVDADCGLADIAAFRHRLAELRAALGVGFAIDDLGSGYATFERMMQLGDVGVKISRSVLHHPEPLAEIGSVLRLADRRHHGHTVIVEGVDDLCPVSLQSLYRVGVRSIQGHVTGLGGQELGELPAPTRMRLAALVRGAA
jgi:EAL domain-containing protein (putative c-di-GMP-specific phosphodiesterase class I)